MCRRRMRLNDTMCARLLVEFLVLAWLITPSDGFVTPTPRRETLAFNRHVSSNLSRGTDVSGPSTGLFASRYSNDNVDDDSLMILATAFFKTSKQVFQTVLASSQQFMDSPMAQQAMGKMRVATGEFIKSSAREVVETTKVAMKDLQETDNKEKAMDNGVGRDVGDRPSDVSLPVGVIMGLAVLPFFATLSQTLLTFGLFAALTRFVRSYNLSSSSTTDFSAWDRLSLGIAAAAGYMLTPPASTKIHGAMAFPGGTVALIGLLGITCVFLFQDEAPSERFLVNDHAKPDISLGRMVAREENKQTRPNPVERTERISLDISDKYVSEAEETHKEVHDPLLSSWDKEFEAREADERAFLERNQMNAASIIRPSPLEYHHLVYRDCYAPPGPLGFSIHSTPKGPAIHTIKMGSTLYDHVHPGDLLIGYGAIDTRSLKPAEVMKLLADDRGQQRKITVVSAVRELAPTAVTR